MKRIFNIMLVCSVAGLCLASCNKLYSSPEVMVETSADETGYSPILFEAGVFGAEVETKAVTEVTNSTLSSFYASATTGSAGSEVSAWTSSSFSKSGSTYVGGKYWPNSDPGYHFFASNLGLNFAASGTTVSPTGVATDVVCAYLPSPTYKSSNQLSFQHIFGRIGTMTVSAATGYTLSNISITITPKVPQSSGTTYNLRTGAWSGTVDGSSTQLANSTAGTKTNDFLLVPGSYTLTASYTVTRGDYVENVSSKTATVEIPAGKTSNISCTLGGNASEIVFTVDVAAWQANAITATFN